MKIKILVAQYVYWAMKDTTFMKKKTFLVKDISNLSSTNGNCINVQSDRALIETGSGLYSEEFNHGQNQSSEILPLKVKLCLICYQLKLNQGSQG